MTVGNRVQQPCHVTNIVLPLIFEGVLIRERAAVFHARNRQQRCHPEQAQAEVDADEETFVFIADVHHRGTFPCCEGGWHDVASGAWKCRRHFSRNSSVSNGLTI